MHQNRCRLGLAPDPTGGAYSAPPDALAGFKGAAARQEEGNRMEGREGLGSEGRGEGRRKGNGEGRGKGKVGGIAPWLLGIDAPVYPYLSRYVDNTPNMTNST